ncbi:hypothetical protein [Nocardioides baekrokdamisoli]|uniref:hypothetical protein n=1 Tax=Nocardioides baekrokdamisoli TaxID=1804624 RepID=UPI0013DDE893|nr:hypothetical protein [Nocardioides baekrokdamisoli]
MEGTSTRRWRLRGYAADDNKKLVHQSICRGDRALDESMAALERDKNVGRITVEPGR